MRKAKAKRLTFPGHAVAPEFWGPEASFEKGLGFKKGLAGWLARLQAWLQACNDFLNKLLFQNLRSESKRVLPVISLPRHNTQGEPSPTPLVPFPWQHAPPSTPCRTSWHETEPLSLASWLVLNHACRMPYAAAPHGFTHRSPHAPERPSCLSHAPI